MSKALTSLNKNLREQAELYNILLTLEENKKNALIRNSIQEIELLTAQEEALIIQVNHLEKERLMWAEQIGRELGTPPENLTLAELVQHFPALEAVSLDLDQTVLRLKEIHEINSQLLHQAMKIVDFTVGLLTYEESKIYNHPGNKDENRKRQLMDWRI